MQSSLSFDQTPPFAAPLRFFLSAPVFLIAAGLLLCLGGGDLLVSRWTPGLLAIVHLLTVGFMLQIMLGSLIQILPVVAGAHLARPVPVARWLNLGLSGGTVLLAAGFWFGQPRTLQVAGLLLGGSVAGFLGLTFYALRGVQSTSPTIRGLKIAFAGLAGAVGLGVLLAVALARGWALPIPALVDLHIGWALGAWSGILLAAIAYVVVPMFQLTPGYPARASWWFPVVVVGLVALWSLAALLGRDDLGRLSTGLLALVGIAFAGFTMRLQSQRRRARADATYRYWQTGAASAVLALGMLFSGLLQPAWGERAVWSIAIGILLLLGVFVSVIVGMLYKIVPFLAWMHLQQAGCKKIPPMNKLLSDAAMERQFLGHFAALAMLLAAALWPELLARPAGAMLAAAGAGLFYNLLTAVRRYRKVLDGVR